MYFPKKHNILFNWLVLSGISFLFFFTQVGIVEAEAYNLKCEGGDAEQCESSGVVFNLDPKSDDRVTQGLVSSDKEELYAQVSDGIRTEAPIQAQVSFPLWQKVLAVTLFLTGAIGLLGIIWRFAPAKVKDKIVKFSNKVLAKVKIRRKKEEGRRKKEEGREGLEGMEGKVLPFSTLGASFIQNLKLIYKHPDFAFLRKVTSGWMLLSFVVGTLGIYGLFFSFRVLADTTNWPFTTGANYTYDSDKVEIVDGVAKLKMIDQTDDNQTDFDAGTYNHTQWDGDNSWVEGTNTTPNPIWELPDNASSTGWTDMTGNVLLMHMNDKVEDSDATNNYHGIAQYDADTQADSGGPDLGREGSFDSTDDFISVPDSDDWFFDTDDFSISFWINFDTFDLYQSIIGQYYDGMSKDWIIQTDFGGTKYIKFYRDGALAITSDALTLSTDTWYYFTFVRDSGTLTIYKDGVAAGSGSLGDIDNSPSRLEIGGSSGSGSVHSVNGDMDEVAIYDKALNSSEISNLYNSGNGYSHTGSEDSLISVWHMNEDSWKIQDTSGGGNNGTAQGGVSYQSSGKLKSALDFDGSSDEIELSNYYPEFTGDFAITLWVYFINYKAYQNPLSSADNGNCQNGFWIEFGTARGFTLYTGRTKLALEDNIYSLKTLKTGQWYFITIVRSGTGANNIKLYVNNSLAGQNTYTGTIGSAAQSLLMGKYSHTSPGDHFHGTIDEVAIYNRALSETEVLDHYNNQKWLYTGAYTSSVEDAGGSSNWDSIAWTPERPIGKELPNDKGQESGYPTGNADMTGNVLLMHMNEASGTIVDTSGEGNDGTVYGGVSYQANGKLNYALKFNGGDYINIPESDLNFNSPITVCAWIQPDIVTSNRTIAMCGNPGTPPFWFLIRNTRLSVYTPNKYDDGDTILSTGQWYHACFASTHSSGGTIYLNGQSDGAVTPYASDSEIGVKIGSYGGTNYFFDGTIDEVAIYNRVLSGTEIADIYKRGILRLKYQVRSDSSTPLTTSFIGPDGTAGDYYEWGETNSTSTPSYNLTNVPDNQYFQYNAYFLTDIVSASPELKSVTIGPSRYPANNPTVVNIMPTPTYSILSSFSETMGGGNQGSVKYQISGDGTNWYYWNSSNWVTATSGYDHSNTAAEVNTNCGQFDDDVGAGNFYFKSFLHSSGSEQVELDQVDLDYALDNITVTSPASSTVWEVDSTHDITWTFAGTVGSTVNIWADSGDGSEYDYEITASTTIGAGGTGSYTWFNIPVSEQGTAAKIRICSNEYPSICDETDTYKIVADFDITDPNGGETWGALSARAITWTTVGSASNVNLYYSTLSGQAGSWNAITECTNVGNIGSCSWTLPNLDNTTTVRIKVEDASDTEVYDASDADFTIDYYIVTWNVLDSQSSDHLDNLSVTDSSGWSESGLASPMIHDYPYGIYTTIWVKNNYQDKTESDWTFSDPALMTLEKTVYMESVIGAEPTYNVFSNFSYDAGNDELKTNSWLERNGLLLADPDLIEIKIYDDTDSEVSTLTSSAPDTNGVFWQDWQSTGMAANKIYFARTTITRATDTFVSGDAYSIAIPAAQEDIKEGQEDIEEDIAEHEQAQADERSEAASERATQTIYRTNVITSLNTISSDISTIQVDTQAILTDLIAVNVDIDYLLADIASVQAEIKEAATTQEADYTQLYNKLVTINSDLAEVVSQIGDNVAFQELLSISSVSSSDIYEIRNKLLDLQAVSDNIQVLVGQGGTSPAVTTWFTFGSVVLNMLITNPTGTEQEVPFKAYLPKEVNQEHIIDLGGMEIAYDAQAETYYVHTIMKLAPGESITRSIEIKDIWVISEDEVASLRSKTEELYNTLAKTAYNTQAVILKSDIDSRLDKILRTQEEATATPQDHIVAYRNNLEDLEAIENEISQMRDLIVSSGATNQFLASLGGVQTVAVWGIIIALVVGVAVLGTMFFRVWKYQMVMSKSLIEEIAQKKGSTDNADPKSESGKTLSSTKVQENARDESVPKKSKIWSRKGKSKEKKSDEKYQEVKDITREEEEKVPSKIKEDKKKQELTGEEILKKIEKKRKKMDVKEPLNKKDNDGVSEKEFEIKDSKSSHIRRKR